MPDTWINRLILYPLVTVFIFVSQAAYAVALAWKYCRQKITGQKS